MYNVIKEEQMFTLEGKRMRTSRLCKKSKRMRKVYLQKVSFFFIAVLISLSICVFGGKNDVSAHEDQLSSEMISMADDTGPAAVTYYKSIEVKHGDTLWNIAETYMNDRFDSVAEYVNVLKDINNLDSYDILAGSYLMVCYAE